MARFTIMTTPKWIRSIPSACATGTNNGVKIYNAEVESRKHPAIRRMMFTIIKNTTVLPPVAPSSAPLIATSSFALVRTYANRLAVAVNEHDCCCRRGRIDQDRPELFQFNLAIYKYSYKQSVHCGHSCSFCRSKDSSVDTSQDDDRHHKPPERIFECIPFFFTTGLR